MRCENKIFLVKKNVFKKADYQLRFENVDFQRFLKRRFLKIGGPNTTVSRFFAENAVFLFENGGQTHPEFN